MTATPERIANKNEKRKREREKQRETWYHNRRYRTRFTEHSIITSVGCCMGKASRYRVVLGILWVGIGLAETSRAETICESAFFVLMMVFFFLFPLSTFFFLLEEVAM